MWHIMLIMMLVSLSESAKIICICDGGNCNGNCPQEGMEIDYQSNSFYKEVSHYVGRDKDIKILIGTSTENDNYLPEIEFLFFINRNLEISALKGMYKIKNLIINIDNTADYQFTTFSIKSVDFTFKLTGAPKTTILIDKLIIDCNVMNPIEDYGKYNFQVNELVIRVEALMFFKSITLLTDSIANVLVLKSSKYFFDLSNKNISVSYKDFSANILFKNKIGLTVEGNRKKLSSSVIIKTNASSEISSISFYNVANIYFDGNWEDITNNNIINGERVTIYSSIGLLPFNINVGQLRMFVNRNLNIPKKIYSNSIALLSSSSDNTKLFVFFQYLLCPLDITDARIDVTVDTYEHILYDSIHPVTLTISESTMTHVTINNPKFYKTENIIFIEILFIRVSFNEPKAVEEIPWLFENSNRVFTYPANMIDEFCLFYNIQYTMDSDLSVRYLRDLDNSLKLKAELTSNNRYLNFVFNNFSQNIFGCPMCFGRCPYLNQYFDDNSLISDLYATGLFDIAHPWYQLLINNAKINVTVGLHNIPHDNMNYTIDCTESNITVLYRKSKAAIDELNIYNCAFASDVEIYAQNAKIFGGRILDDNAKVNINSDIVIVDESSFEIIRRSTEKIKNLRVQLSEKMSEIKLNKETIEILGEELEWNRFENLSISLGHCRIENNVIGKINGFSLFCNTDSDIRLTGDWSKCEMENGLIINLNYTQAYLFLESPYFPSNLQLVGPGSYKIFLDYIDHAKICVYNDIENKTLCDEGDLKLDYEQFQSSSGFEADNLTFYFVGFDDDLVPEVNLSIFSKNKVEFVSEQSSQFISIVPPEIPDPQLSHFTFVNMLVLLNNEAENGTDLVFSTLELVFSNFVSESFKERKLVVNVLICEFVNLVEFGDIEIVDKIELSGHFINEEKLITIPEKEYSGVLRMVMPGPDDTLFFGNLSVVAGGITFQFLANYPQCLNVIILERNQVVFVALEGTEVAVNTAIYSVYNAANVFEGNWDNVDHYFYHEFRNILILVINGVMHYKVNAFGILRLYARTEYIEMTEEIRFHDYSVSGSKEIRLSLYSELPKGTWVNVTIRNMTSLTKTLLNELISTHSPDIHTRIVFLDVYSTFSVSNRLSRHTCSSIVFENDFHYPIYNWMYLGSDVVGPLLDVSEYAIFNRNFTLVTLATPFVQDREYLGFFTHNDNTHGFHPYPRGCFDIFVDRHETTTDFILYPVIHPDIIPYGVNTSRYDKLILIFSIISENINTVNLTINFPMSQENYLPLSMISFDSYNISMNITGHFDTFYFDSIGSSIRDLGLNNLIISQDIIFPVHLKKLTLKYIKFNVPNITRSRIDDVEYDLSTFLELQEMDSLQEHYKKLAISNVYHITFNENGFVFHSESGTKSLPLNRDDYDELEVKTSCSINLNLNDPANQNVVTGLKISLSSCIDNSDAYVVLGDGWDKVSNIQDIQIVADDESNVIVATPIYPVPSMRINKEYQAMFNPLVSNLTISDKSPITQDLYMEIPDETKSHYVVNADNIIVSKSATIRCGFNATINLNSLKVNENSNTSLYNFNVNQNILSEAGARTSMYQASLSPASMLEIHWSKDRWSSLFINLERKETIPKQVMMILDETEIDYNEYHKYTYRKEYKVIQGNFDCGSMMQNIHFNSTDPHFSDSNDLIFSTACLQNQNFNTIVVRGVKELPIHDSSVSEVKSMKTAYVISIAVAVILVLCVAVGFIVFYISRKKFQQILSDQKRTKRKHQSKATDKEEDISLDNINEESIESEESST